MKTYLRLAAILCAILFLEACFYGCAATNAPPNAANVIVGTAEIAAAHVLIGRADARLQAAYKSGQITYAVYDALYHEEQDALTALDGLGTATIQNKPVTQADVDAALAKFVGDISTLVPVGPIGPELPPK